MEMAGSGMYVYVSHQGARQISTTGRVTPAGHVPVAKEPRGFNIDPFGRHLLAAGLQANTLTSYRIDSGTGALTKLAEYPTADGPNWIEFVRLP